MGQTTSSSRTSVEVPTIGRCLVSADRQLHVALIGTKKNTRIAIEHLGCRAVPKTYPRCYETAALEDVQLWPIALNRGYSFSSAHFHAILVAVGRDPTEVEESYMAGDMPTGIILTANHAYLSKLEENMKQMSLRHTLHVIHNVDEAVESVGKLRELLSSLSANVPSSDPIYCVIKRHGKNVANIYVTGEQLVGKSSLINALLRLPEGHVNAAEVTERGTDPAAPKSYESPLVPGIKFTEAHYGSGTLLKAKNLVLVLIGDRLVEKDAKVLTNLMKTHAKFYLVRTKCDLAIRQVQRRKKHMSTAEAEAVLRDDLGQFLDMFGLKMATDRLLFISAWQLADDNDDFMDGREMRRVIEREKSKMDLSRLGVEVPLVR